MIKSNFSEIANGLGFPEGPRWHNNKLFFSDFHQRQVRSIDLQGNIETVAYIPQQPSGLGWLPDGQMLIVSMADHKVLKLDLKGQLSEYANLSSIATGVCNDMVVDAQGRAYIGNFGGSNITLESTATADLAMIDTDGTVSIAAKNLVFPNGAVITPDNKTLIIAETMARQLTAFNIDDAGKLYNRRVWANTAPHPPDGICIDSEGGVWVAAIQNKVIRVLEGGRITHSINTDRGCFACALGGAQGKTLYLCLAGSPAAHLPAEGKIVSIDVEVAAANWLP